MREFASLVIAGALLVAGSAQAQSDSGAYLGIATGVFDYQEADDQLGVLIDDSTQIHRLIGGYQLNENLAIEGALSRTGDIKETFPFGPPIGDFVVKAKYDLFAVRALGLVPLDRIDFYGGLGYYRSTLTVDVSAPGLGLSDSTEDDDSGVTLLGGVHFYLDRVIIRGEYEWFNANDNVDLWDITVGVLFRF